jgi:hypothetical protein
MVLAAAAAAFSLSTRAKISKIEKVSLSEREKNAILHL